MNNNINNNTNSPYIPNIVANSGLDITYHSYGINGKNYTETSVLTNGIYEKHYRDGKLVETVSKIKDANGGLVETRFNPQGERIAVGRYDKEGVPSRFQFFDKGNVVETTTFLKDQDNVLFSQTINAQGEVVQQAEYDENYQLFNCVNFEKGKVVQTRETRIHPEGPKVVKHEFLKTNEILFETFNTEGEIIAEQHFKDRELIRSLDVQIDTDTGLRYVTIWNKENADFVTKNVFKDGRCLAKYIYQNQQYVGFIECIYDATENHYEVLFDPQGNKISCSTYNQNNELIEKGVYEQGVYRITTNKRPQPNNDSSRSHE